MQGEAAGLRVVVEECSLHLGTSVYKYAFAVCNAEETIGAFFHPVATMVA